MTDNLQDAVEKAKEKLGDENATIMAEYLGLEDYDPVKMKARCCFHNEKTPSLSYDPKTHRFHCFSCGATVDIIDVLIKNGNTFHGACRKLFELAGIDYGFNHESKDRGVYRYPHAENGDMNAVREYLNKRKISNETIDILDISADNKGNIVFNYYDTDDELVLVKYRPARTVQKGEPKTWCQSGADTSNVLWNMSHVRPSGTLLICEGEIDCASFIEAGFYQSVSIPLGAQNLKWIEENWDFLQGFDTIIIAGDGDKAGQKMTKEACARLSFTNVKYLEYPDEYIFRDENNNPIKRTATKDANAVLQTYGAAYLFNLVLNAKETPIDSVIKMSNVEEMNVYEMDGIEVGIKKLDDALIKIFCGGITIITGKASAGKTTFLNQIALSAMDQGMPVFLFSRELVNAMSKDWYKTVGAGIRNMHQIIIEDKRTGKPRKVWVVNKEAKAQMDNHYRDMLYVYRDDASNDAESLINTMEQLARRRGVKCFMIDNLMTVLLPEDKEGGTNGAQTKFISELTRFSIKYNAIVILVAHPRKTQSGQEIGLDDISGSMNIVNLAVRTIGLRRVTDKEKEDEGNKYHNYDVVITSVKDRIFGSTIEVPCHYSKSTRRFFTSPEEWDRRYDWDKNVYQDPIDYCDEDGNEWIDDDGKPKPFE